MEAARNDPVKLGDLDAPQLGQVKKQLDEELEHLTSSFGQLYAAQTKFRESLNCVNSKLDHTEGTQSVLIPLTNSLYVQGEVPAGTRVIVDIGTGFLVEKDVNHAIEFYQSRIEELSTTLKGIEGVIQQKKEQVSAVQEALRQKLEPSMA